ncbi:TonB-dependent receptor plug domain-containing protein [Aeoliella sp.]|uniref:TonB-dependent receptor plug domain-containing protein n=1 Tax=Aeoliella sp. TaxID=2795800 RepID=UPI003CCBF270
MRLPFQAICLFALLLVAAPLQAQPTSVGPDPATDAPADGDDVLNMDLDQLSRADVVVAGEMNTEVSIAARTDQPISRTASAVFVITDQMIRRSGARNIPEALRIAPGVHVARINSAAWAISIRGFTHQFANKLLVQVDGRATYNAGFSGTYWDHEFPPIETIDRIEVIRGPGASVWGANAVNGVINIVTKSSCDTQGMYIEAGGGNEHRSFSYARAGGGRGDVTYRIYGQHIDDETGYLEGAIPPDGRNNGQAGFRTDWSPTECDTFTLTGDYLSGTSLYRAPTIEVESSNLMGRWNHRVDDDTNWTMQVYYNNLERGYFDSSVGDRQVRAHEVFDFDSTLQFKPHACHDVVCGFGYRKNIAGAAPFAGADLFDPDFAQYDNISYFIQDTWTVVDDLCFVTLGCKLEHNDFVGFVYQPTAKIALTPNERTSVWGSVSRAVRNPSRVDLDLDFTTVPPAPLPTVNILGNPNLEAEQAMTYELGIRRQPTDYFYWDLAVFYSRYEDIIQSLPISITPSLATFQPINGPGGPSYGGELWGTIDMTPTWSLRGWYAFLRHDIAQTEGFPPEILTPSAFPRNLAYLTSSHDLAYNVFLDGTLRYSDGVQGGIGSYLVADVRLAYRPRDHIEFSVVGQNLLDDKHLESLARVGTATEVQSGVYGMISWEY